jgi:uncharacterized protein with PhoU and TrkA domain
MGRLKKVEYRPISVREALVEIKDLSELMLDLAYSAALFNSKELAEEVIDLGDQVDILVYLLNMSAILATRDPDEAESLSGVLKVGSSADKISDAAVDMASIVLRGITVHPLVQEAFRLIDEQLSRIEVKQGSILNGKKFSELELAAKIGVNVIALRRDKTWIIHPEEQQVEVGDILIIRGAPYGLERLRDVAEGKNNKLD